MTENGGGDRCCCWLGITVTVVDQPDAKATGESANP
jgi:hypothetical protein